VRDFVHELTSFPAHKFDDQVDAISQGVAYLRERLDEPGIIGYCRLIYEETHGKGAEPPLVTQYRQMEEEKRRKGD
jgi:hypothetical protein